MVKNPLIFTSDPDPDPGHLREGPSHLLGKKIKSVGEIVFELRARADKHTQMHYPHTQLWEQG